MSKDRPATRRPRWADAPIRHDHAARDHRGGDLRHPGRRCHRHPATPTATQNAGPGASIDTGTPAGLQTTAAPWSPEYAHLPARLAALRPHDNIVVGYVTTDTVPTSVAFTWPPGE